MSAREYITFYIYEVLNCCIVFIKMLLYCVVILASISSDVVGMRQFRSANENVSSTVSSVAISSVTSNVASISPLNKSVLHEKTPSNSTVAANTTETAGSKTPVLSSKDGKIHSSESGLHAIYSKYATGAALRGLYVFAGLSAVVLLYIGVKLIRLRRKKTHIQKYGLLANAEDLEMAPLDADDDDEEDTTLFDAHNHIGH